MYWRVQPTAHTAWLLQIRRVLYTDERGVWLVANSYAWSGRDRNWLVVSYVHFPQSGVQSGAESGVRMQIDRNHLASH